MRSVVERRAWLDGERGISAARWILVLAGAAVMLGGQADGEMSAWLIAGAAAAATVALVVVLSRLPRFFDQRGTSQRASSLAIQVLDVGFFLGLTVMLSGLLRDASWAVLAIPIVLASLRLGAAGVLAIWLGISVAYTGLERVVLPRLGEEAAVLSTMVERSGVLLAIAASLALLTRWLQTGWLEQALHAEEADQRLANALAIERASRQMRAKTPDEVLDATVQFVGALGFEAATLTVPGSTDRVVGDGTIIPAEHADVGPEPGVVELTVWNNPDHTVYSASAFEPRSGATVTGWTPHAPSRPKAEALGDLIAQTSTAVETAELFEQARHEADHDTLTGLANRARFERHAGEIASRHHPVAMMFMDLDRFKQVNDTLGHDEGDRVLRALGNVMRTELDAHDLVARFGGDEFVAILSGSRVAAAHEIARRIHESARAWIVSQQLDRLGLGVSIGVACGVGPVDLDQLRVAADEALYVVKREGRGATAVVDLADGDGAAPTVVVDLADTEVARSPEVSAPLATTGADTTLPEPVPAAPRETAAAAQSLPAPAPTVETPAATMPPASVPAVLAAPSADTSPPLAVPVVPVQPFGAELADASQPLAAPSAGDWRGGLPSPAAVDHARPLAVEVPEPILVADLESAAMPHHDEPARWPAPDEAMSSPGR